MDYSWWSLDGQYADPNNQTIDCTSAQPEGSQGRNRTTTNLQINGNDCGTLDYLSAQPGNSKRLNTADTSLEFSLDSPLGQPGISEFSPNKATTNLEMNLSAQQGSFQTPATACSNNPKRKSSEGSAYVTTEKKRQADKAYRERCREVKDNIKAENDRLKTEMDRLKVECDLKNQALRSQEEENKHLQQKVRRLESNLRTKNNIVEFLTKQLVASQNIDLQHENTNLKGALENIVEALCPKINTDKDHEEEHKIYSTV